MLCYIYYICIYAEGDSCASNSHNYTDDIGTLVVLKRTSQVSNGIISSGDSSAHHPPDSPGPRKIWHWAESRKGRRAVALSHIELNPFDASPAGANFQVIIRSDRINVET